MRSVLVVIAVFVAATDISFGQTPHDAFVLSLSTSGCDLSPYYQAVVAEATAEYRGDAKGVVFRHVDSATPSKSRPAWAEPLSQLQFEEDPFSIQPFPHRMAKRPKELVLFTPLW